MAISIIIPAYNEEKRLGSYLQEVLAFLDRENLKGEVVVVDDGSRDGTVALVREWERRDKRLRLVIHEQNRGKGAAVRTGMVAAVGQIRGFCDADGATPIAELLRVLPHFEQGAQVVIGSRAKRSLETSVENLWYRKIMGRTFNFLLSQIIRLRDREKNLIQDTQCGFKWFSRAAAEKIFAKALIDGFAFDVEILFLANRLRLSIVEQPVNWCEKGDSRVNLMRDPLRMLRQVAKISKMHGDLTP